MTYFELKGYLGNSCMLLRSSTTHHYFDWHLFDLDLHCYIHKNIEAFGRKILVGIFDTTFPWSTKQPNPSDGILTQLSHVVQSGQIVQMSKMTPENGWKSLEMSIGNSNVNTLALSM